MAVSVVLCLCAAQFGTQLVSAAGGTGVTMEYESKLFDPDTVLEINILMGEDDWQDMLDSAMDEEYVSCDVEIGDQTFYRVGIRPKGNTSLSSIANDPDTERYSMKLEFDHFVEGQTCYGLDKLILNNSYADATYMKEALIYDLFKPLGADASLYSYAKVSVNGEYWGLYLALEAVEDSFLLRNYGTADGELYKPDSLNMGGGAQDAMPKGSGMDFHDMPRAEGDAAPKAEEWQPSGADMQKPEGAGFMGGQGIPGAMMGGNGSNLNYIDDQLDSYSAIWDGEVTETGDGDHKRVVAALKNISEGVDLERYMDVDNLVNYMAVHIFSENADSLSGSMAHNYYLYEDNGRLNLLPWDYNLAFGGMGGGDAASVVNGAIDEAWNGTDFFDSLLADEEHHDAYSAALEQVVRYIQDGGFDAFYSRTRSQIDVLVESDPTAFYSYEEYLAAADTLYEVVSLRGQSIQGQLDGSIPSTDSEQRGSEALIDASQIDLSVMGSMNTGGGGSFGPDDKGGQPGEMPQGTSSADGGEKALDDSDGFTGFPDGAPFNGSNPPGNSSEETQRRNWSGPAAGTISGMNGSGQGETSVEALVTSGVCFVVMLAALLFALFYRRRPRKR